MRNHEARQPGWAVGLPLLFTLLTLILLSANGALAQGALRISGNVQDEKGDPIVGAQIVLTPSDREGNPSSGGVVSRVKTNKKGKFTFGFAKPGDYALAVEVETLAVTEATVKMRGAGNKPVYGPDGQIEDRTGAVDPANPVVTLGIPPEAFKVEVDLILGVPQVAAQSAALSAEGQKIVELGLGEEVDQILAKLESRRYDEGLVEVDALIADKPELAPLHYLRGYSLFKLNRTEEAEAALGQALRLDPAISGVSGLLGQVLAEQGRFDEAVPALRRELGLPDNSTPRGPLLLSLGQALLELDQVEEAVVALEESFELDPDNEFISVQLVDAYIRAGNDEAAEKMLREDLDAASAAILHFNLAANMLRTERWEQGAEHMRQALEMNPALAEAHKYLAQAYLAQGKRAEAVMEFEAYVTAVPNANDAEQTKQLIKALNESAADE